MVAGAEAANGADALGERADDEIDIVLEPRFIGKAAAVLAEDAEGMRLIDEQLETVFLLDLDEIGERCAVAQHRIDALEDDEPAAALVFGTRQPFVEIARIIVTEAHQL